MAEQTCKTCAWHDGFSWVCFNGESEHRADFTLDDQTCPCWQKHRKPQNGRTEQKASRKSRKSRKSAESPLAADGSTADGGSIGC